MNKNILAIANAIAVGELDCDPEALGRLALEATALANKLRDKKMASMEAVARKLGLFAIHRAWAMRYRRVGNTDEAMNEEVKANDAYRSLPDWVRVW